MENLLNQKALRKLTARKAQQGEETNQRNQMLLKVG